MDSALERAAHHLELDEGAVVALRKTGLSQRDMLGVAYLAKASGRSVAELVELRRSRSGWWQVSRDLGFPMDLEGAPPGSSTEVSDRGEENAR